MGGPTRPLADFAGSPVPHGVVHPEHRRARRRGVQSPVEWEIQVPEIGVSVFEVPRQHVRGKRRSRVLVCNSVAQSVVDSVRGQHNDYVFVYRRERVKNVDLAPLMQFRAIETMNNTAWQRARREAGLGDLHVHDLRHTVGMRLREAGVPEGTIADILWHSTPSMTHHYSVAQIVVLHAALEKVTDDNGRWNKSLATLRKEHEGRMGRQFSRTPPAKKNGLEAESL